MVYAFDLHAPPILQKEALFGKKTVDDLHVLQTRKRM